MHDAGDGGGWANIMKTSEQIYIPKPSPFDPDDNGHFGEFGGRFVPETLMPVLLELNVQYNKYRFDNKFI